MIDTTTRNATLEDLVGLLQQQHTAKIDMVVPATKMVSRDGIIHVTGAEQQLTDDGVTTVDGQYRPTVVMDEGIAEKLGVPVGYLKRLRETRPDLYDANVNGWLHGQKGAEAGGMDLGQPIVTTVHEADPRSFLLRAFRDHEGGVGVGRALLSDTYKRMDNLDVLTAALDGVRQAGVNVEFDGCDLTDRRMHVRIVAPEVQALAPILLKNYRSPFRDERIDAQRQHGGGGWNLRSGLDAAAREGQGYDGQEPIVFAGFAISNSEVGGGAFSITPRLVIKVCKNGLTIPVDALRAVHLGTKLEEGTIRWSDDTSSKALALVTAKTRDAVTTFLDVDYVSKIITRVEEKCGVPVADPNATIKALGKRLQFDQQTQDGVLAHFIRGADTSAGGMLNAVTSYAQTVADADDAAALESKGMEVLELAAVR